MNELPKKGLYVSTKNVDGMKLIVEDAFGDEPDEFYLVNVIDAASSNDAMAMADEMDKEQWETLVKKYGLEHRN